eukprot:TRINITY_DN76672_c0_g1_i1.p1 TRINITY_DN76672_c0_g1~~TRINITY_DN76672_c0_g1_i1.p1  ORF type:complete len:280 (-),score=40.64 TRINITY_DN76672_c0_g1_i1:263-1000(-)
MALMATPRARETLLVGDSPSAPDTHLRRTLVFHDKTVGAASRELPRNSAALSAAAASAASCVGTTSRNQMQGVYAVKGDRRWVGDDGLSYNWNCSPNSGGTDAELAGVFGVFGDASPSPCGASNAIEGTLRTDDPVGHSGGKMLDWSSGWIPSGAPRSPVATAAPAPSRHASRHRRGNSCTGCAENQLKRWEERRAARVLSDALRTSRGNSVCGSSGSRGIPCAGIRGVGSGSRRIASCGRPTGA